MKAPATSRQRGAALMLLLVLFVVGSLWWIVSSLSTPSSRTGLTRDYNARALQQAKAALIGYVAQQAAQSDEQDPGRLPCPQNWGDVGGANEGRSGSTCIPTAAPARPAIGWLPWRTLGLPKLLDASGQQLWYVVSPGWALPTSGANLVINSETAGQITLDGQSVVALIIASGSALSMQACGGAAARVQTRTKTPPALDPDYFDYLECENAVSPAGSAYVSSGPMGSFNDQILAVTAEELLPAIEAAVAARFARDFGAAMGTAYCGGLWKPCSGAGSAVYLPFAATFQNPATSNFQGSSGVTQGLLPFTYGATQGCLADTPSAPFCAPPPACDPATDSRCSPSFVTWRNNPVLTRTSGANLGSSSCSVSGTPPTLSCTINAYSSIFSSNQAMNFTLDATANNVGMSLRQINAAVRMTGVDTTASGVNLPFGYSATSATMNSDGSATIRISSRVPAGGGMLVSDATCGLSGTLAINNNCYQHTVTLPFIFVDPPFLRASDAAYAWFYRNRWHESMYYAVAPGNAPNGSGTCVASSTCLVVLGLESADAVRSIVVTPGRRLPALGQVRPPAALTDWLEYPNENGTIWFSVRDSAAMVNRTFNDHIALVAKN